MTMVWSLLCTSNISLDEVVGIQNHKKLNHTLEDASIMKLTADNEFISVMDLKAHELN